MLEQLRRYALRKGIRSKPGFATKEVHWIIDIPEDGSCAHVIELWETTPDTQRNKKSKRARRFTDCPDLNQNEFVSGNKGEPKKSHFLLDSCEVVVLYGEEEGKLSKDAKEKHETFVSWLEEASSAVPELAVAVKVLRDEQMLKDIRNQLKERGAKASNYITFRIAGKVILEDTSWHDWWNRKRQSFHKEPSDKQMVSFVTGELITPAKTHPKIKGLAGLGGQSTGSALISFDKDAFQSYGLEQSENCALSEEEAYAYKTTLEYLLEESAYRFPEVKLAVAYWFKEEVKREEDPLAYLNEDDAMDEAQEANALNEMRKLLEAINNGKRPDQTNNRYYVLILSGAGGRVRIQEWIEGEFKELVSNVEQWFEDLDIAPLLGTKKSKFPKFPQIVRSLIPSSQKIDPQERARKQARREAAGENREANELQLSPTVVTRLLRAALTGSEIPDEVVYRTLSNIRSDLLRSEENQERDRNRSLLDLERKAFRPGRVAVLKAATIRHFRKNGGNDMANSLQNKLSPHLDNFAYHFGRLLAVVAKLQEISMEDSENNVVQRFYTYASSSPQLVFDPIMKNVEIYLSKLSRKDNPNGSQYYQNLAQRYRTQIENIISQIVEVLDRTNQPLPHMLEIYDQALFALGYYRQSAELRRKFRDDISSDQSTETEEALSEEEDYDDNKEDNDE